MPKSDDLVEIVLIIMVGIAAIVWIAGGGCQTPQETVTCPNGTEVSRESGWDPSPAEIQEVCAAGRGTLQ